MRIFRSLSVCFAMALAMCGFSFSVSAAENLTYQLCAVSDLSYHASVDKLHAELTYNAIAKTMYASTVDSSLLRDSNGFRQRSADEALPLEPSLS